MSSSEALKKVMAFIGGYRFLLLVSILLAGLTVVLQLYVPILFGDAIDSILGKGQVDFSGVQVRLVKIAGMIVACAAGTFVMNMINNRMAYKIVQDIRSKAIRHIQVLPLSYLDAHSTGDIVGRIITDVDQISDGLLLGFTQLFSGIITIIVTLFFMFSKSVLITFLVLVLTPVSFLVARFISTRSFRMFRKMTDARGRQTALIEEMVGNEKVVKAFGYEDRASARFAVI
ncbi:MAG TPA: sugar ABC transporter ATP-binding protein, partial [Lachnospiraceae bacterium]|nr:sugar ABC transporter ATP-binding protein [Lachnospiraceae bacterium]